MSDVILNDDIIEAHNKVVNGVDDFNVMMLEFGPDHITCELTHSSSDGFEAVKDTVEDDVIAYAVLRINCVDIIQTRDRFVFLTWNAPGAEKMERGKIVFQQQQILSRFGDIPMFSIEIDGMEKLSEIHVAKVLNENLGSDRPDYYTFGPDDIVELFEDQLNHITGEMAALFTQKRSESQSKSVRLTESAMSMNETISSAWEKLKSSETNHMVLGLQEDNFNLVGTGTGGFDEMVAHFNADNIFFSVLRVPLIDVVRHNNKFIFITYMGENVPMVQTARAGFQQQKAKDLLKGVQILNYEVADTANFSQVDIAKYLLTNAGGDMPEKFKFGPNDYVMVKEDQLIHERTEGDDPSFHGEEKKDGGGGSVLSGEGIGSAAGIDDAWTKVLNEQDGYNFLVVGMKKDSLDNLELVGTGDGGFNAMQSLFDAKRIMFAILRIPAIDVVGQRSRFVFLIYIGDSTTPKEKSRVVFQADATKKLFTGVTLKEYQIPDNDDLSQVEIAQAVDKSSGAGDRPDRYEFGPNDYVLVEGDQFVHSTDASGRVVPKKKGKVQKSVGGSQPAAASASGGGTKTYQVKAWKEERVKLKGERNSLQRKLKTIEKRLDELDDMISGAS